MDFEVARGRLMNEMSDSNPNDLHIPDLSGKPICGRFGRTSAVLPPTCPLCRERSRLSGMRPSDFVNPGHPIGRITLGSGLGLSGFPEIPGLWKRFKKD